jgi:hypothetical protein
MRIQKLIVRSLNGWKRQRPANKHEGIVGETDLISKHAIANTVPDFAMLAIQERMQKKDRILIDD